MRVFNSREVQLSSHRQTDLVLTFYGSPSSFPQPSNRGSSNRAAKWLENLIPYTWARPRPRIRLKTRLHSPYISSETLLVEINSAAFGVELNLRASSICQASSSEEGSPHGKGVRRFADLQDFHNCWCGGTIHSHFDKLLKLWLSLFLWKQKSWVKYPTSITLNKKDLQIQDRMTIALAVQSVPPDVTRFPLTAHTVRDPWDVTDAPNGKFSKLPVSA
jgi:hypothetical protein